MSTSNFLKFFLLAITFAICQAIPTNSLVKAETKAVCPGFLQEDTAVPCWSLNGKCYCFSATKRVTWTDADKFCKEGGMTLLNLESKDEDQMINSHIKTAPELADDYYWISGRFSNNRWEWATHEPLTYTHWYPGEPSHNQIGSFAYINYVFASGIWFDEIGVSYILFICESIADTTTTESTISQRSSSTTTQKTTTPSTTTTETTTPKTTEQENPEPTTSVDVTAEATTEVAPTEATTEKEIPTEATTEKEVTAEATTKKEISTDATTEKEIPTETTTEKEIPTEVTTEKVPTQPTTMEASTTPPLPSTTTTQQSTTVSESITTRSTTPQTSPTPTTCPSYLQGNTDVPCWTLTNGKCYCFSKIVKNWTGADSFCRGGGMALLKIENSHENNLIYNHYTNTPGISKDIYWTSGRYSQEGNARWEWATTKPYQQLIYKNWYPFNPVQPDFNQPGYCMYISFASSGYWFDVLCTNNMKFVCESK